MFQFSGLTSRRMIQLHWTGLPHSEIPGSNRICQSPELIAAYHVLHRLWEPRHPPCALNYFIYQYSYEFWSLYFLSICQRTLSFSDLRLLLRISSFDLWRITDSNRWPSACKADALASWANSPLTNFSSPEQTWTADPYIISVVL